MSNSGLICLGQLPTPPDENRANTDIPAFCGISLLCICKRKVLSNSKIQKLNLKEEKHKKISHLCVSHLPHLCFISYRCSTRQHVSYLLLKTGTFPNGKNSPELNVINRNKGHFPQMAKPKMLSQLFLAHPPQPL